MASSHGDLDWRHIGQSHIGLYNDCRVHGEVVESFEFQSE